MLQDKLKRWLFLLPSTLFGVNLIIFSLKKFTAVNITKTNTVFTLYKRNILHISSPESCIYL